MNGSAAVREVTGRDGVVVDPKVLGLFGSSWDQKVVPLHMQPNGAVVVCWPKTPSAGEVKAAEREASRPVMARTASSPEAFERLRLIAEEVRKTALRPSERILREAVRQGASDIHIGVGKPPYLRVGGELRPIDGYPPLDASDTLAIATTLAGADAMEAFDGDLDLDFESTGDGQRRRFRVNVFGSNGNVNLAIRLIPPEVPTFTSLGIPPRVLRFADAPAGLVLFAGPTGSGKSTTQAAMIRYLNEKKACHIVTIEDPVEYFHEPVRAVVNQRRVGPRDRGGDTVDFARGIRAAMRQDPDVILIGEMRDHETTRVALEAAETGHLVFATVHARDAQSTFTRIVSSFPADMQDEVRIQLSQSLIGLCVQRILPRKTPVGSRCVVCEVLVMTDATRALVREGKFAQIASAIQTGGAEGMQSFDKALARAVAEEILDRRIALAAAADAGMFSEYYEDARRQVDLARAEAVHHQGAPS